jgi:Fe-S-cluster containining protein
VYALSIHADYACHRSGVCCTSDWDVPVELPLYHRLEDAIATGRLRAAATAATGDAVLVTGPDLPDEAAAMVSRTAGGDCVFYHRRSGLCVIHRDMGASQLPATCRYFPRLAMRDRRGTFITLTHYCPTAAAMLFREDRAIEVVENPPAFPAASYEGLLIGTDDWPPLLHPRMLMGHEGYTAWERHMVARCAEEGASPESVVATLERDARLLRQYRPGAGPVEGAVASLPPAFLLEPVPSDLTGSLARFEEAVAAVPDDMKPPPDEHGLSDAYVRLVKDEWDEWQAPLRRYLAAKAFASWTAYQGRGVLSIVRGLEAALALVRVEAARQCRNAASALHGDLLREAFRAADFLLNHLAAGDQLAEAWSRVENDW